MHDSSYAFMTQFVSKYLDSDKKLIIGDVGSLDVNGAYHSLFLKPKWRYEGIDLIPGSNVDIVVPHPYNYFNIPDNTYDVVISGQTLEHVKYPYLWIKELKRILKPGGLICIITVWNFIKHESEEYKDYWRVLPSGMKALFQEVDLKILEVLQGEIDTVGIGTKPL